LAGAGKKGGKTKGKGNLIPLFLEGRRTGNRSSNPTLDGRAQHSFFSWKRKKGKRKEERSPFEI